MALRAMCKYSTLLTEAEVSEQPLEGVLGEGSEWKERVVALGTAGRGSE